MSRTHHPLSRASVDAFVHSSVVQNIVIGVILLNAAILGMEAIPFLHHNWGAGLVIADKICLAIFVVEILLKLYGKGWGFFRSSWNNFDFFVVAISLIPGADTFAVLRALRVLRVLRLISAVPSLRRVVDALMRAIPGIASIAALLAIVFYVGGVMATMLFGKEFPDQYGDLGRSLFSLFQVMTLDDWSGMARKIWVEIPWAPAFFVPFVLISAMTVLNLFIAVIVDAMQGLEEDAEADAALDAPTDQPLDAPTGTAAGYDADAVVMELAALREQVSALTAAIVARETHDRTLVQQDDAS